MLWTVQLQPLATLEGMAILLREFVTLPVRKAANTRWPTVKYTKQSGVSDTDVHNNGTMAALTGKVTDWLTGWLADWLARVSLKTLFFELTKYNQGNYVSI